jgi:hypothetical protein
MTYIQINIGRNIELADGVTGPMAANAWHHFQSEVTGALVDAVNATVNYQQGKTTNAMQTELHTGTGTWDGVAEESAHISLFHDVQLDMFALLEGGKSVEFAPSNVTTPTEMVTFLLETHLPLIAATYGQDAIAFIVTDSHLASGK